ncbi:TonB system transport protein ExbD [Pectobacterium araliae]|uniref:Biopolymer transport protein ExbD n=1 Tax=Pectobacterium araliae TaxID=3073862 RepID=A0AAN0MJ54_9GAMM|nr:TonB system transport protein ExbD [Pectobacterium sp. MAFF 302110]GKW18327.1 TonB system transport protein ExbD [Pectobacterium carotovorum subsp. carotovorum]
MAFSSQPASSDDDLNALHEINVTPFIDVMLVLLIIFMVAAPLSTVNIPLDLPSTTQTSPPVAKPPLIVSVKADMTLYIGDNPVPREKFSAILNAETHGDKNARVFLRADKRVDYERLMAVMDMLRDAGYAKVALIGLEASAGEPGK